MNFSMKCEKVTLDIFIDAWFNHYFTQITKDDFDTVYSEYIDISGLYNSKEFELFTYINYLKNTIFTIKTLIASQLMFIETFHQPYIDGLHFFEKLGHKVEWDGDEKKFISKMDRISSLMRAKNTELKRKEFEFNQLKEAKKSEDKTPIQSRHEFIKMLNTFNKNGYHIDKSKTTVEELALMIKQTQDEHEKSTMERINRK